MTNRSGTRGIARRRTPFEWGLLAVSIAATLILAGGLLIGGLAGSGPADLRIAIADAPGGASGGRALVVTISNVGETSAAQVVAEVTVGEFVRELTIELVARGDTQTGVIVVPAGASDPPTGQILSYIDP
jgi:uncharacterized protein (TIGR02588 family)